MLVVFSENLNSTNSTESAIFPKNIQSAPTTEKYTPASLIQDKNLSDYSIKIAGNDEADLFTECKEAEPEKIFEFFQRKLLEFAFSKENFHYFADGILRAVEKLIENHGERKNLQGLKTHISKFLKADKESTKEYKINQEKFIKSCKNLIKDLYKKAEDDGVSKKDIDHAFLVHAPNNAPNSWGPMQYTNKYLLPDKNKIDFKLNLTPVSVKDTNETGNGITSNDKKSKHLRNCWIQKVSYHNNSSFGFIRNACTNGKKEATEELLAANLKAYPSLVDKLQNGQGSKDNPIPLKLANIQLLSPNLFGGDKNLHSKQMKAITKLQNEKSVELKVDDKSVWVRLESPFLFNFGSNRQHFNQFLNPIFSKCKAENTEPMKNLLGADIANKKNSQNAKLQKFYKSKKGTSTIIDGMNFADGDIEKAAEFFGKDSAVGKYLTDSNNSDKDRKIVFCLAAQIADIWSNDLYYKNSSNPYAIQERLMVILYKLGYSVSINCKSGKDRTGILASYVLPFVVQVENGYIIEPYADITPEQKINILQSMYTSLLITKFNTLLVGFVGTASKVIEKTFGNTKLAKI
ncbi:MAG: hypothetical protein LBI56_03380 [Puniceicoccales bacterium]|jgi:hypothetical protein|nr:hypothetical protein [Puniceicoccales bacterium]